LPWARSPQFYCYGQLFGFIGGDEMLCPMKFGNSEWIVSESQKYDNERKRRFWNCEEGNCAWWFVDKDYSGKSCCAIKVLGNINFQLWRIAEIFEYKRKG